MRGEYRTGIGYDIHPFATGRRLVLGGVAVAFDKGLAGWSDADVLTHAIMDALLGAANLGDIGQHFPSGEAEFRDIASVLLLARVREMLKARGWEIGNIDASIIAEQPELSGTIKQMRVKLSVILEVDADRISVKAKTGNGLGAVGHGEGIAAQAIASIYRVPKKTKGERCEDI